MLRTHLRFGFEHVNITQIKPLRKEIFNFNAIHMFLFYSQSDFNAQVNLVLTITKYFSVNIAFLYARIIYYLFIRKNMFHRHTHTKSPLSPQMAKLQFESKSNRSPYKN